MSDSQTLHHDVNAILNRLLADVRSILGQQFVGMYLYGSLALGDFNPLNSDIDFLVVTGHEVRGQALATLQAMHKEIGALDTKWAMELEGSYISTSALRRYDPTDVLHPHIDRGGSALIVEQHDADWVIQRYSLRKHGVTLAGPPIETLIDPISSEDLRQAVSMILHEWWEPMTHDPIRLQHDGYHTYAVLSMCRILYTLDYGDIISKPVAAKWANRTLPPRWTQLIERAEAWQMRQEDVGETQNFIQFTLERSKDLSAFRKADRSGDDNGLKS